MCKIQAISRKEFSFQFSDDEDENDSEIIRFIETLTLDIQHILPDKKRQSEVLQICLELLSNTCDHVESEMKTASIVIFFAEDSIYMQYTDSGDFFTRKNVKETLESRYPIKSTRENGCGGAGTQMLTRDATTLDVNTTINTIFLSFK